MYGNYVPGKLPCRPNLQCMFRLPWVLTRDYGIMYVIANIKFS